MLQAGLPLAYWPLALSYAATAYCINDSTLVNHQPDSAKSFPLVPFGAKISIKTGNPSKYEPSGELALFAGWRLQPGLRFRGEILYILLDDFQKTPTPAVKSSEALKLLPGPFEFPLAAARVTAFEKKLVETLFPHALPFDAESDTDEPTAHDSSSSSSQPVVQIVPDPAVIPPAARDNTPADAMRGPVGRPATARPPTWSSSPELIKRWNNFSSKKREQLTREYREKCDQEARQQAAAAQIATALVSLFAPAPSPEPLPVASALPVLTEPEVWFQPEPHSHRPHEPDSDIDLFCCLVTRQLVKKDPEYHPPGATKDRSVASGHRIFDSTGQPLKFGNEVTAHTSNIVGINSVVVHSALSQTGTSLSDAIQAFVSRDSTKKILSNVGL